MLQTYSFANKKCSQYKYDYLYLVMNFSRSNKGKPLIKDAVLIWGRGLQHVTRLNHR